MPQVLGESMAGISQHCKTGDVVAFGESVGVASKALCGLTEAAGQVRSQPGAAASARIQKIINASKNVDVAFQLGEKDLIKDFSG